MPIDYNQQSNSNNDYSSLLDMLGRDREFINNHQQIEPNNRYRRMLQQELAYQAKDNGIDYGKLADSNQVDVKIDENAGRNPYQTALFNSYLNNKYSNSPEEETAKALDAFSKVYLNNQANTLSNIVKGVPINNLYENGQAYENLENPLPYSGSVNLDKYASQKGITTNQVNVAKKIVESAEKYGIDPRAVLAIASNESGMGKNQHNIKGSGAMGTFQFMPGTWKQYGKGRHPLDIEANIDAGMRFTQDNINIWKRKMGRAPNYREIYLMHFLGAGDGSNGVKSRGAIYAIRHPNEKMPDKYCEQNNFPKGSTWKDAINRTYSWSDKAVKQFM